jgi:O-antigen/teichoic acid export membrane protein
MSPFRNILKLSIGDFAAKAAYFLAFVYMAQKLGVERYGVLEFALAVRTYLLLLADAGLELWAIREAAKGEDPLRLTSRVIPGRLALALFALLVTGVLALTPGNPHFRRVLPLLTLTVLIQAFNLKWVFMGRERMTRVAIGLVASQLVFAACAVMLVHQPSDLILVPLAFLASELVIAVYFWRLFVRTYGRPVLGPDWSSLRSMARPVLTLGAAQCLGLMNYNVDSILIGLMLGPGPVGWYAAAYKPITAALTVVVTYYQGLFPALSRSYHEDREKFRATLLRSLRFTAMFAIPLGVGGSLLAQPVIHVLFGPSYAASVQPLQLLSWSAVLVTLRGNFRYPLNAAGKQQLDLTCAGAAAALNVILNLLLIPRYGIVGAASATLGSEIGWFLLARYLFARHVLDLRLFTVFWRPVLAGCGMAAVLMLAGEVAWVPRAGFSLAVYGLILILSGEPELRGLWFSPSRVAVGSGQ